MNSFSLCGLKVKNKFNVKMQETRTRNELWECSIDKQ